MRHLFGYFRGCMSCAGDGLVGGPVGAIASEKLPGERGGAKIIETGAGVSIPPIALVWHLSYPPSVGLFSDRLILLCCFVEIMDRAAIRGRLSVDALIDTGAEHPGIDHLAPFNECNSR
jgi:hypothetical protein